MCGIFGASTQLDYEVLKDVLRVTSHRGPDNTGIFIDHNVSLGHNRLSIIDISANSNQPMQDATGKYHIIYNGELYNFIELRESLKTKGYKFHSNGDAEVILYSFIEYGPQCVQNFDGIFMT
jgi:asparagine synthase (glutamine-hydrolysing)